MADTATATEAPSTPRGGNRGRGNRSHQHNRNPSHDQDSPDNRGRGGTGFRGGRGSRGRGRGRGNARDGTSPPATFQIQSGIEPNSGRPPGGGFGVRLTEAAAKTEGDSKDPQSNRTEGTESTQDEEVELCFICASPIEHVSVAPCNHQTCHICSLRLRALYKTRACAHCRVSRLISTFTDNGLIFCADRSAVRDLHRQSREKIRGLE